jgi:hypothetical protein
LKTTAGATIRAQARSAWSRSWTSGWFWQLVPSRFQMNPTASSRSTSTPRLARLRSTSAISVKTRGLDQFRSHWKVLKVVQIHLPVSGR